MQHPCLPMEAEATVFSVCAMRGGGRHVVVGGSVPQTMVWDAERKQTAYCLGVSSGLCMGFDAEQATLAAGSFQGMLSVFRNVSEDARGYLGGQSVRYLKSAMALRRQSWSDVQEKGEMIDKLLLGGGSVPTFPAASVLEVTPGAGLVHAEVVGDFIYCGGFEGRIHAFRASGRDGYTRVGEPWAGHATAVNCMRAYGANQSQLISCGSDGFVRMWDRETSAQVFQVGVSTAWLWSLSVYEHGFSVGGVDYCMRSFDDRAPQRPTSFFMHDGEVSGLCTMLEDVLLSSSFDGNVRVFERRDLSRPLHTYACSVTQRLTRVTAASEGRAWVGSFGGEVFQLEWK